MNPTLLKKELRSNYKLLLIFLAVLAMYGAVVISMFNPELGDSLHAMAESMPEIFAAVGMADAGTTLLDFLANYLYGFLFVVFPMVFLLLLSNRLVSRYVDRGSMACLLATPNRRGTLILTQAGVLVLLAVVLDVCLTGLCILFGGAMFPGELDIPAFLRLNAALLGLHLFLSGLCFCSSCIWNEAKLATGVGAGVCIAFVLLQMVSRVGEKFEFLKFATPLTLFDTGAVLSGDPFGFWGAAVLYAAGILLFALGSAVFCKKDLPV